jgi:uncharacterized membrane protein
MRIAVLNTSRVLGALCTALFTGLLWAFEIGVDPMLEQISGPVYADVFQKLIGTIDRGIPPVLIIAGVAPIVVLVMLRKQARSRLFLLTLAGWLLFGFGVMVYTIVFNVPINNYILTWDVAAPPDDWANARDRWNMFNTIRTPISILATLCFLLALMVPIPGNSER